MKNKFLDLPPRVNVFFCDPDHIHPPSFNGTCPVVYDRQTDTTMVIREFLPAPRPNSPIKSKQALQVRAHYVSQLHTGVSYRSQAQFVTIQWPKRATPLWNHIQIRFFICVQEKKFSGNPFKKPSFSVVLQTNQTNRGKNMTSLAENIRGLQ